MSTRATYQFNGDGHKTTIYIHFDGYPEGAASYFWNMLHVKNDRGGWATQFIRANDNAEITDSHEGHGDTEYRYTLNEDGHLKAESIGRNWEKDTFKTKVFFTGHFADFINKYGAEQCEGFEPLQQVQVNRHNEKRSWLTPTQLIAMLENKINERNDYAKQFPQWPGNTEDMTKDVEFLQAVVNQALKEVA